MRAPLSIAFATLGVSLVMATASVASAAEMDSGALKTYAGKPWDKAALSHSTVELGSYHGVPVIAEFPCADVCPQYTVRIIQFRLPADATCASAGGVEKDVLVPIAITVRMKTVCVPEPLVASDLYYSK